MNALPIPFRLPAAGVEKAAVFTMSRRARALVGILFCTNRAAFDATEPGLPVQRFRLSYL
jgi:hypothetical protein